MDPEHRLLKFVIVPLLIVLIAVMAIMQFNPRQRWTSIGHYYPQPDQYRGDKTIAEENIEKFINTGMMVGNLKSSMVCSNGKTTACYATNKFDEEKIDENSRFRVASISKIFTSIAVMQLVHQGKLSLDDKVEKYVIFEKCFDKTPTVGDLLCHTAGYDNNNGSFFYHGRDEKPDLEAFVYRNPVRQAIEPHKVYDYTNIGFDIAGLIVQKVSGVRFEDYCKENIFKPLGMTNTSFDEPESWVTGLDSKGNVVQNYFVGGAPSGGLISTAKDMGRFINCIIGEGVLEGKVIFEKKLVDSFFEVKMGMGELMDIDRTPVFWSSKRGGITKFTQNGKILGFSSSLVIERGKAGAFSVSADQSSGQYIANMLMETFFFPPSSDEDRQQDVKPKPIPNPEKLEGQWINMFGWNRNNAAKIANAAFYNLDVDVEGDTLYIDNTPVSNIDGLTYGDGWWYVQFVKGDEGRIKYLQTGLDSHVKARWFENAKFLTIFGLSMIAIFVLTLLQGLFGLLLRWFGKEKSSRFERLFRLGLVAVPALNIIFAISGWIIIENVDIYMLGFKPNWMFYAVFTLPIVSAVLTIPLLWGLVLVWRRNLWNWQPKVNATILILTQCLFVWFCAYWNLLGYNF